MVVVDPGHTANSKPMKIVIATRVLVAGGVQRVLVDQVNEFTRQGHEVWVVTFEPERVGDSIMHECAISSEHLRLISFPRLRDVAGYKALVAFLRDIEPDVFITHHWFANTVGRIAALGVHIPYVFSFEHSVYDGIKLRQQYFLDWLLQTVSTRVIAVSANVRDSLGRHNIASCNIAVLRNGISLERYTPVQELEGKPFLFIGRLVGDKHVDVLLRALARVPGAQLTIVGDGPERVGLEQLAHTLGIRDRVEFLGVRYDIPHLLQNAQALVLPSRREGFGLVVVEALASGVPVIASSTVGAHGVVQDGINGAVVATGDNEALAQAMKRFIDDGEYRRSLARAASQNLERFSIATHCATLLSWCAKPDVLYVANIRLPTEKAHGLHIMKSCEALQKEAQHVQLVVPVRYTPIDSDPNDYYRIRTPFPITHLSVPDTVRSKFFGFHIHTVLFTLSAIRYVRRYPPCTVYGRDSVVLLGIALCTHHRTVWESHDGSYGFFSRLLTRRMKGMVVVSTGLKDFYTKHGVPKENILAVPNGVDLSDFSYPQTTQAARQRLSLPLGARIALYIGRLDGWKGTDTLIKAATLLAPDILVAFIGGEKMQVEERRREHPDLLFLGERPYGELADNQAAADVLVLPNTAKDPISVHFTSPLKLLTYMASERPIVASDLPSIREIARDTVVYVAPDDAGALAKGISWVCAHPDESAARARVARALVEEYTWESRTRRILSFIQDRSQ